MTQQIFLKDIIVRERLRKVDPGHVEHLTAQIGNHGLLQPVVVRDLEDDTFLLLAGAHRLEAALNLGWDSIEATVKDTEGDEELDALKDELFEVTENLDRKELSTFEQSQHVNHWSRLEKAIINRREAIEAQKREDEEKKTTGRVSEGTRSRRRRAVEKTQEPAEKRPVRDGELTKRIAKTMGKSERTVQQMARRAPEIEKLLNKAGVSEDQFKTSRLDRNGEENDALVKLFKFQPATAIKLVQNAIKPNRLNDPQISAIRSLKMVKAKRSARKLDEQLATKDGCYKYAKSKASAALNSFTELQELFTEMDMKADAALADDIAERLTELHIRWTASDFSKVNIMSTGHKYEQA